MSIRIVVTTALVVAASGSVAVGNEVYKIDQVQSKIGFSVHQFLGATHGKFAKFDRSVKQTGAQAGDITGDLTMHGVTKPVTLHVKLVSSLNETNQTRWSVTTDPLQRRDFNLMFAQAAESMSGIAQTVAVNIEIVATRGQ